MRYAAAACQTDFPCPAGHPLTPHSIDARIAEAKKRLD